MLLHLLEDDTDHLNETGFCCILVYLVGTRDVDIIERTHYLQQATLVDFCSAGGYYCQESPDNLELDLLVSLSGALIHFIYYCINKPSG